MHAYCLASRFYNKDLWKFVGFTITSESSSREANQKFVFAESTVSEAEWGKESSAFK